MQLSYSKTQGTQARVRKFPVEMEPRAFFSCLSLAMPYAPLSSVETLPNPTAVDVTAAHFGPLMSI